MATCPTCRTHHPDTETVCPADGAQLLPEAVLAAADAELKPGTVVGEYCIEGKLGEGGFGCVYRAVHPVIGKTAAVKVLHYQYSANPQMVSRFVAEARAVNQIRHRGIIDIFSFGRLDDGRQYYVMELLDGMTFDAYLKQRGRLPPEEAIVLLRQIARALDAAHAGGIAHRDLKPENIFLVFDEDGGIQSKLLDFGIAKLLGDSSGGGHVTRTGVPMGTPLYMSPEQCRGRNVDHRTDVYSFGVMTFEVLTGCFPFEAEDMMDLMFKHVSAPPARPSAVCPDLSPEFDGPVLEMLEKEADRRPRTLAAAVDGLVQAAQRAGLVLPSSATRSTSVLPRGSGRTQVRSGADAGEVLADARTVAVSGDGSTMPAAKTGPDAGPSDRAGAKGGKTAAMAILAVLLVGAAVGAAVLFRPAPSDSDSSRPASAPDTAAPPAPPPPSVVPAPASASAAPAALPREIELTIQSKPVGAEVFQGDKRLGVAPGPILLPRGDADVELTLKAKNHKPFKLVVRPSENRVVSAELEPVAAVKGPSGASTNKMLEF